MSLAITTALTATSVANASSNANRARSGGTVTYALPPGQEPDMILPFFSFQYFGVEVQDFMYLMYRPLYYFTGKAFQLTEANSLAYPPTYNASDTVVTVKLKPWSWSDGEKLSPADIAFYMGILQAEKTNYWAYIPGDFPTNVASATYDTAADTVTFHLKGPVNPTWFTYNQISYVQPMPSAWDLSGPGKKSDCSGATSALEATCPAVYKYLEHEASNTSTYASNPLWQVVDGPFRLSSYSPGGLTVVLVPNKKYSGSHKAKISAFDLKTFTSEAAEYDVLKSGTAITVGYLPFTDAPTKPNSAAVGHNPLSGYTLEPWLAWAIGGMAVNWNNPTVGLIEHQLYFRQALQSVVDQQAWIRVGYRGYAYPQYGPVPDEPKTPYATKYEETNPYPFSVGNARHDLTSHGWTIPATGPATCTKPGTGAHDCGAGISKGEKLTLTVNFPSGEESALLLMETLQSQARKAGLYITLSPRPEDTLIAVSGPCTPTQSACKWQATWYGEVESEAPYWWPDNGILFICHSAASPSNYCNPSLDAEYSKVYSKKGLSAFYDVENYETQQAIQVSFPTPDLQLTEVSDRLGGYTQSGTEYITPQNWYFKS